MQPLVAFLRARLAQAGPRRIAAPSRIGAAVGGVRPSFNPMTVDEAAELLQGLYRINLRQFGEAVQGAVSGASGPVPLPGEFSRMLHTGQIRYIREDPDERWRSVRDIVRWGGGDCEDLAAAVAAEMTVSGRPARPVIYRVRPGLSHAVVQDLATGELIDPSRTGGMGRP